MVSTRSKSRANLAADPLEENQVQELENEHEIGHLHEDKDPSLTPDDNLSERDDKPTRDKKRARTSQATSQAGRKKYVRGKQGGLQGLMRMPIEIFTEIACLLWPEDLLALAWSNKFFHGVLFQRSAVHIWQCAQSNVPGLPPCPSELNEPQYAALVFSKTCTLCGATATARPDVYLVARLCSSCRDTELQELNSREDPLVELDLIRYSPDTRPKRVTSDDSRTRYTKGAVFGFKSEIEEAREIRQSFLRKRNKQGLAKWEGERRLAAQVRDEHAKQLRRYLGAVAGSREEKVDQLKEQRQNIIFERLKALNWTDEDLVFKGPEAKPWHALVSAPKPLTDRIWTNMLPKLTQILEENRERHALEAKKQRRIDRLTCVDRFLMRMKYLEHPFEPIFQALGVPTPPPPDFAGPSTRWASIIKKNEPQAANPFPKSLSALKWECLKEFDETEMSIEEVEAKLEGRKDVISEKVLEWRALTEQQLVERLGPELSNAQDEAVLVIDNNTDLATQLSRNTRLLLRADTVFKQVAFDPDDKFKIPYSAPCYYPRFISSVDDHLHLRERHYSPWQKKAVSLDLYARDTKTERVVKLMLQDLGLPDVSHIELKVMGERFMCGRCCDYEPDSWTSFVWHFLRELDTWDRRGNAVQQLPVRHGIELRNVHDIESPNTRPLVQLLSQELASKLKEAFENSWLRPQCYLCQAAGCDSFRTRFMIDHMKDRHDVTDPVEGIHYGDYHDGPSKSRDEWYEKWDEYHDALLEADDA
ncbi:hypothetical protein FRC12_006170 [Ceratobasidium sp. 428]|nr:hypothetical protein FRC12_006170 [Ceratobasidium sp. 428]